MSLFSVNTNLSALAALQSLDQTQEALNTAQNAVSTGKTVGQASDNPAIYSISNTINANIAGLSAVSDSLNFGAQVIQTASSALTNVQTVLENLQQTVTESGQTGISTTTLQSQVTAELASIDQYGRSATFNGVNVLTTTGDSGAANGTLNIVEGLSGTTYNIANQAATLNAGATTLSQALGLGGLSVTGGGTTGVSLTLNQNLLVSSFSPTTAATPAAAGTDAVLQLTAGTQTYDFEFTDDGLAANPLQSAQGANTTIVAVHINSTTQSTNQIVASLVSALGQNGFAVQQNSDGSLNVAGQGLTAADFGTVLAGTYTSGGGAASGIVSAALTNTAAVLTTVTSAITNANTVSDNLGAASQQITGIQNFTSSLSSALTAGVGALTDADLSAESATLSSLQTKQQLATQSLSIANQQPQTLLTLFKNL